uniref:50S ribosomal protein L6 n=1 Tax=Gastroclonium compressum TaxID=1852973 RepID=A0A173G066_GASCM|nr:50S ribosomal protein L6 [Coeloseira compressa]ANH09669.1 50S ribosomal protein L6 [Coeloseira compressa]
MSRIGKQPIIMPDKVKAKIESLYINIEGPKGRLKYKIPEGISLKYENNTLQVCKIENNKKTKSLYGLARTIISNMVIGVNKGFYKKLEIQGVGYRSQIQGNNLILNVGYSHQIEISPPKDISISVENNTLITVHGINKTTVGQIAAQIRSIRKPEPYKGKGIRYINEKVRRKIGKAGK